MHFALLTVQGANRPGIVAEISRLLHTHRINISDSSMTSLRSEFVMMLLLEFPIGLAPDLMQQEFAALEAHNLRLHLQPVPASEAAAPARPLQPTHAISVLGPDQTGIVYRVSSVLAAYNVNILDVDTQLLDRQDQPLYAMILEIDASGTDLNVLERSLTEVAQSLGVDLNLHPVAYAEI
ncbi:MAG TPA: ACT domain-containing protein [Candidatus Obscuribacterales bacterium]